MRQSHVVICVPPMVVILVLKVEWLASWFSMLLFLFSLAMRVNAGVNHWGGITTAHLSSVEWCWIFYGIFEDQVSSCAITVFCFCYYHSVVMRGYCYQCCW